ncbi:DUF4861 domain-containing protein [Flammeovirgaceae bacterium SG7u.111]|nr:DUF4861 domain-containing protein [Flammeovirgaceae bacterium SG7u.132]WPO36296.1 DUF4861 domain-containing protein [Flammeovirgaceae bacterium SG7u.111]
MSRYILFLLLFPLFFSQCAKKEFSNEPTKEGTFSIANSSDILLRNSLVSIDKEQIANILNDTSATEIAVLFNNEEIASQTMGEALLFIIDSISAKSELQFQLKKVEGQKRKEFAKKTQAEISVKEGGEWIEVVKKNGNEQFEYQGGTFQNINELRVPDKHTDHSFYIRYEGPGWESDLVGYRFYLDWRNATDIFGKSTHDVVLQDVGQDGFDSYHEQEPWGMDVLKVGKSLGIGAFGVFEEDHATRIDKTDSITCKIAENGSIYSSIKTSYFGWKVAGLSIDLESNLSIHAGTRLSHHQLQVSEALANYCTGIVKDDNATLFTQQGDESQWGFIATYGKQSLNNDNLGLAVFFASKDFKGFREDEHSHIVKINSGTNELDYYFLGAWEGEKGGIKSEAEFIEYIKQTAKKLAQPVKVQL